MLTVSKALAKSKNSLIICFLVHCTSYFVNIEYPFFIQPGSLIILCSTINLVNPLYISLLKIFENIVNIEIGLMFSIRVASPFLKMGTTLAIFSSSGTYPLSNDTFRM